MLRAAYSGRAFEEAGEIAGQRAGRALFFQAVHRVEPQVVADLMGEPLSIYRPLFEVLIASLPAERRPWWRTVDRYIHWNAIRYAQWCDPPAMHRLRELLVGWSEKWNLDDDWCLEAAAETLAVMSAAGDAIEPQPLVAGADEGIVIPFSEEELGFEFSHRGWSPTLETWESAEARLDAAFAEAKKAYREHISGLCVGRGLRRVGRQYKGRLTKAGYDPWTCLAMHQVCEMTYEDIAGQCSLADPDAKVVETTIGSAVRKAADRIGLTLRDR